MWVPGASLSDHGVPILLKTDIRHRNTTAGSLAIARRQPRSIDDDLKSQKLTAGRPQASMELVRLVLRSGAGHLQVLQMFPLDSSRRDRPFGQRVRLPCLAARMADLLGRAERSSPERHRPSDDIRPGRCDIVGGHPLEPSPSGTFDKASWDVGSMKTCSNTISKPAALNIAM
jgi:hypothetical protein